MKTYYASAQELWDEMKSSEQLMSRDFELSHYGDEDGVSGYVLLYKGMTHDIYKVNKTVQLFYNKLVPNGFEHNVQLTYRKMNRPDKYNEEKQEAVIEIYPGLHDEEDNFGEE